MKYMKCIFILFRLRILIFCDIFVTVLFQNFILVVCTTFAEKNYFFISHLLAICRVTLDLKHTVVHTRHLHDLFILVIYIAMYKTFFFSILRFSDL